MKVEVAVLGCLPNKPTVSVDVKQHSTNTPSIAFRHFLHSQSGGDSVAIAIQSPSSPTSVPPSPLLLVPNKPHGFCGR